jgi:hypothetical protein
MLDQAHVEYRANTSCPLHGTPLPQQGVEAFFGKWPGDETDADLLGKLDEIRKAALPQQEEPAILPRHKWVPNVLSDSQGNVCRNCGLVSEAYYEPDHAGHPCKPSRFFQGIPGFPADAPIAPLLGQDHEIIYQRSLKAEHERNTPMISNSQEELQSRYEENVCAHGIYAKDYCGLCNGPTPLLGQDEPAKLDALLAGERIERTVKCCVCSWYTPGVPQSELIDIKLKLTQALTSLAAQKKMDEDFLYSRNKWHMVCNWLGWPADTTSVALITDAIEAGQKECAELKISLAAERKDAERFLTQAHNAEGRAVRDYKRAELAEASLAEAQREKEDLRLSVISMIERAHRAEASLADARITYEKSRRMGTLPLGRKQKGESR